MRKGNAPRDLTVQVPVNDLLELLDLVNRVCGLNKSDERKLENLFSRVERHIPQQYRDSE
jgi:hypothetical protein